jgi:hypothetical protein
MLDQNGRRPLLNLRRLDRHGATGLISGAYRAWKPWMEGSVYRKFWTGNRLGHAIVLTSVALPFLFGLGKEARAATCDGQKGKVIYEDTFADDSGGWTVDTDLKVGGGTYAVHLDPKYTTWTDLNSTFDASEADYCVEAVMPKSVAPDNAVSIGLVFWATDYDNKYVMQMDSTPQAALWRTTNGKWTQIGDLTNPTLKPEVGSVMAIRVVAANNLIAPSVNGVELKKIRAKMPSGTLKFGLYVQTDKDNPGLDLTVKRVKVTEVK